MTIEEVTIFGATKEKEVGIFKCVKGSLSINNHKYGRLILIREETSIIYVSLGSEIV